MGDVPTTDNKAIDVVDNIIKGVNSVGCDLVVSLAIAQVPFLGLPVIRNIFSFIVSWLDGYISKAMQIGASFAVIDIQIGTEESAVKKAIKNLIAATKSGDPHVIDLAVKRFADAQSALDHFNGVGKPR